MERPSRPSTRRRILALALASGLVAACGGSAPAGSASTTSTASTTGPGSVPPASSTMDWSAVSADEAVARADPSLDRLGSAGERLDAMVAEQSGELDALGPVLVDWLAERRTAVAIAALDADGVKPPPTATLRLSSEPIAAVGPIAQWAMTWLGAVLLTPLYLQTGVNGVGTDSSTSPTPTESRDSRTEGDLRVDAVTTTTRSTTVSGSVVTVDVDVRQTSTTTNTTTGTTLRTGSYRTHIRAEMTVCPDASGVVVLKLETDIESSASGEAGFSAHSSMEQRGQVGDDAWLASGSESEQIDVTTTTPGGSPQRGTLQRTLTTSAGPQGSFGSVTGGTGQTSGSIPAAEMSGWMSTIRMVTVTTLAHAFGLAQQKWRDGACVEIRATESSREVAPNEVVPFTATPRHKIEGVDLDKRVVATLSGRLAVDPAGVEQDPPAAVTYTAPSEVDDGGTVTLKSTSNRGIGTLDLTFVVKVRDWSIDEPSGGGRITGQKCGGVGGDWIVDGTYRRAVGPMVADGKQRWVITINEATMAGTYRYTDAQRSTVGGVVIKVDTTIKGTVALTIDDTGRARMVLTETSRKITASTNLGGSGGGAGQPDLVGRLVWQVGGDC